MSTKENEQKNTQENKKFQPQKTEKINSISEVDDKLLEKHFSNHIDNGSMIASNGQNYSQICALIRDMAVSSYMISEYVMTNKLGYVPIPGYYDGNVDI